MCCYDVESNKLKWEIKDSHEDSVSSMITMGPSLMATGDDGGKIKIWDTRKEKKPVFSYTNHSDYITSFSYKENLLISTGGDGVVSVYHCRNGKTKATSEEYEDEITCGTLVRHGNNFVSGTGQGSLLVWNWDKWYGHQLSYKGLKSKGTIDSIIKLNESTVSVGCGNGSIRFSFLSNSFFFSKLIFLF